MYVCICKGITDKQIEEAQKSGKTYRDMCKSFGLGSECGACIRDALDTINKTKSNQKQYSHND